MISVGLITTIAFVFTRAASAQGNTTTTRFIPAYENVSEPLRLDLPALATFFTPAASCLSDLYELGATWSAPWQITGCHASKYATSFSPGLCYSGYEPAVSYTNTFSGHTETVVECCPTGMSFDVEWGCASSINPATTVMSPNPMIVQPTRTTTVYKTLKYVRTISVVGFADAYEVTSTDLVTMTVGEIFAPPIQVRFQNSDSEVAKTWSSIFGSYGTARTSGPLLASTTSGTAVNYEKHHPATPSMIAAIVLGVLITIGILCGAFLICLRRQRRLPTFVEALEQETDTNKEQAEVRAEADSQVEAQEMQAPIPLELPTYIAGAPRSVSSRAGITSHAGQEDP